MSNEETKVSLDPETGEIITETADASAGGEALNGERNAATVDVSVLLEEAQNKAAEMETAYLRARADYANLKRRSEEERDNLRQYVLEDVLKRLLPIVDNLERGLAAAEQTREYDKLIGGVQAVHRQFQAFLDKEGITAIEALHHPFDPNLHNAVLREENSEHPENTIVEELQKGYTLHGKVLRPTMVKVATRD